MSSIEPLVPIPSTRVARGTVRSQAIRFGLVLASLLLGAAVLLWRRAAPAWAAGGLAVSAGLVVVLALIAPRAALTLRSGWMRVGGAIGRVNGAILLGVIYVLIVTPISVLRRLGGRPFQPPRGESYFVPRQERDSKHFEHPY